MSHISNDTWNRLAQTMGKSSEPQVEPLTSGELGHTPSAPLFPSIANEWPKVYMWRQKIGERMYLSLSSKDPDDCGYDTLMKHSVLYGEYTAGQQLTSTHEPHMRNILNQAGISVITRN